MQIIHTLIIDPYLTWLSSDQESYLQLTVCKTLNSRSDSGFVRTSPRTKSLPELLNAPGSEASEGQ